MKVVLTELDHPRIEHLGDVRMIHHRQRLPFRLEPGDRLQPTVFDRQTGLQVT